MERSFLKRSSSSIPENDHQIFCSSRHGREEQTFIENLKFQSVILLNFFGNIHMKNTIRICTASSGNLYSLALECLEHRYRPVSRYNHSTDTRLLSIMSSSYSFSMLY